MSAINDRKTTGLECSFCTPVSRRDFVRTISAGALASAVPIIGRSAAACRRRRHRMARLRNRPPRPLSLDSTRP